MLDLTKQIHNLEKRMDLILDLWLKQTSSLTTYKEVASYLNVTTRTIRNYVVKGPFEKNVQFYVNHNDKTVFIPKAIIAFKENSNIAKKTMKKNTNNVSKKVIHPTASRILQSIAS